MTAREAALAKAHATNREAAAARIREREREAHERMNHIEHILGEEHRRQLAYINNQLAKGTRDKEDERILGERRNEILSHYERRLGIQHNPVEDEPVVLGVAA